MYIRSFGTEVLFNNNDFVQQLPEDKKAVRNERKLINLRRINPEKVERIGTIASAMSVLMYVSYIPQIISNLSGSKGNPIQPLVAFINCTIWTAYGLMKKEKDWPIVWANVPGIFLGAATFITAVFSFS